MNGALLHGVLTVADCRACEGRGWIRGKENEFPGFCPRCRGKGRLTVKMIAEIAKVSRASVYRFTKNQSLRAKTRERIEKAIAQESAAP